QATSAIHAKEAFLCVGRTIAASGLVAVPYHDNVPSFGEWGWWIGGRAESWSPEKIKRLLRKINKIPVSTRYLTPELIRAGLEFGKNQLRSEEKEINTLVNHAIFTYYLQGWQSGY
ncbi:MAG: spermidine synthase, partial [Deltaproteobacteria bacterium]|nr:spermidine synthase [Deltaproteobacteria bacterium]